jgi:hypothetical protein
MKKNSKTLRLIKSKRNQYVQVLLPIDIYSGSMACSEIGALVENLFEIFHYSLGEFYDLKTRIEAVKKKVIENRPKPDLKTVR